MKKGNEFPARIIILMNQIKDAGWISVRERTKDYAAKQIEIARG